ncbi:hypothetical protein [Christiangramia forsetii]|uniref:Secreted protein n=2 Tax=Christiangramia forsetii TaxID=411153 RepID=A0M3G3_CHRFK|nr:hypothetical protein [Christiangramia forsetii]GGG25931.1 hypothetical protein GCM10011532_06620 [Christiangramia forsetii]CAL67158.1 conserved hypothetical protein, secreted [Christiangramia forsetii KT0803]
MKGFNFYRFFCAFTFVLFAFSSIAQETSIMIRAKAKDAKFIGSSIGGAKILVKDALTGEILVEGITSGSTGNTEKIMKQDRKRNEMLSDDKTAGFNALLDIQQPKFITVEAYAPVNKKQAQVMSSTQLWVIPGKHIKGDGVVLDIPGFVVDILSPQTHERLASTEKIEIKANIVMMCGCPVTEDGIWDASQYEVKAILRNSEGISEEIEMNQKNKESTFQADLSLDKGLYEVLIYAYDPVTGNTGVDKTNIIVN